MTQSFKNASITPIDRYRSSHRSTQSLSDLSLRHQPYPELQSEPTAAKRNRNRGVILSQQGWEKLLQSNVLHDRFGRRYTHEQLSEQSLLDVRTISRLLSCEVKVDKSSMRRFFRAFNLQLEANDYQLPTEHRDHFEDTESSYAANMPLQSALQLAKHLPADSAAIAAELMSLIEELLLLKQHILEEYDRCFNQLGLEEVSKRVSQMAAKSQSIAEH